MDAQLLAMVAPQVQPLPNPYDDAALYFGDTEMDVELDIHTETMCDDERVYDSNVMGAVPSTSQVNDNNVTQQKTLINSQAQDKEKVNNEKAEQKTIKKKCIARGSIKEQYFKTKLQTARLEKKNLINREKRENNKYKIEMEILQFRKRRLQGRP
ncbi:uncharacterized protein LOC125075709 [Vanessa atalanta]|uniref:uncharacterized protein LOC125075709 n=1 Tax=Vanessa atalanta TaxID=42275 RepID=UPI001FCDA37D|nr:uncharacterized protein LOC125075709 [Vanessa atalanta]